MADTKNMNQSTAKPVPAFAAPAVSAAPSVAEQRAAQPRRNPGWCLASDLPAGHTSQDMSQKERQASAIQHEAKWKRRYGQAGVVENPWTRGPGG